MANPRRTFYEELGLQPRASGVEIDRAYRAFRKKMDDVSALLGHATVTITQRSYAFMDQEKTAQKAAQDTRTVEE